MTQKEYKEKIIDKFVLKKYETNLYVQGRHLLYLIKPKNTEYDDPRLLITYNVVSDDPTQVYFYYNGGQEEDPPTVLGTNMFSKIEIDGVEVSISDLDADEGYYQLSIGKHTVAYTLKDPKNIGVFSDPLTSLILKIGAIFASLCSMDVIIPSSVKSIGAPFMQCPNLKSITFKRKTPPMLENSHSLHSMNGGSNNFKIYVPKNSELLYCSGFNWDGYCSKIVNTELLTDEILMFDYIKSLIIANAGTLHVDDDNISTLYNYSSENGRDAYLDSTSWEFLNILSQTSDIIGCDYLKIFKTDINDNLAGDEIIKARTLITGGLGLYYYIMKRNNQISVTTGEIKLA